MKNKITKELAQVFFDSLPKKEILEYANNIQERIMSGDETMIRKKNDGTLVTEADTKIEQMIIDCFNKSSLKNLCGIRGEEKVGDVAKSGLWTLLIDPIDGSGSLVKGNLTWGIMVGLLDESNILRYAWNLLSTGDIFATGMENTMPAKISLKRTANPKIDFYDYGSGQEEIFRTALAEMGIQNSELTSCPAAVWAGWKLYQNELSALVWVVGENEKKTYPDYDLIFLATLIEQEYKVRLGKFGSGENGIIVIAPTDEDADMLYKIGLAIVSRKNTSSIKEIKNELII